MKANLKLFFDNFTKLAESPNGIQKLRDLILQLAVQGKLVPQNPNDEPASELLKKIKAEKEKLTKQGKIKKQKPLLPIDPNEIPYKLPRGWEWIRLRRIAHDLGQKIPDKTFTYIDVATIDNKKGVVSKNPNILEANEAPSRARKLVENGTVIYSTVRPYLLNIAVIDRDFSPEPIVSTAFFVLHCFSGILNRYLYHYLRSQYFIDYVNNAMKGMAYPAVNDGTMSISLVPLPPFAEQKRIVAKVDQLMALCDELEAKQQKAAHGRVVLNNSALDHLLNAETAKNFDKFWKLICDNFDLLYDDLENVKKLRQSILQLATQGKLVPQNPKDEPASELLKKIKAEKEKLIKQGKIKKQKPLPPIDPEETPYKLPEGWEWMRLSDACLVITDGEHLTPKYCDEGIPILSAKHIGEKYLIFEDIKYVSKKNANKFRSRCGPDINDILVVSRGGGVGRTIISDKGGFCLMGSVLLFKVSQHFCNKFLYYFLQTKIGNDRLKYTSSATAQPAIYIVHLKNNYIVPACSLNEQKRIVAKVDQLMVLCDELEEKIKQSKTDSEKLMAATIHHLLVA